MIKYIILYFIHSRPTGHARPRGLCLVGSCRPHGSGFRLVLCCALPFYMILFSYNISWFSEAYIIYILYCNLYHPAGYGLGARKTDSVLCCALPFYMILFSYNISWFSEAYIIYILYCNLYHPAGYGLGARKTNAVLGWALPFYFILYFI